MRTQSRIVLWSLGATWLLAAQGPMVPVTFEAAGQAAFVGRSAGLALHYQTGDLSLAQGNSTLRLRFRGASRDARLSFEEPAGRANFFHGENAAHWRRGVAQYRRVRVHDFYAGIDMVLYGNAGSFEQDLIVAPGADPSVLRVQLPTGTLAKVNGAGHLVIPAKGGQFEISEPRVYQMDGAERHQIAARYEILDGSEVGFRLGAYNRAQPLVIDPVFRFTKSIQVGTASRVERLWIDPGGNVFVAGVTTSPAFPTQGPAQPALAGAADIFLMRLSGATGDVLYATYLGGSGEDTVTAITGDSAGNLYFAGQTASTNFPVTPSAPLGRAPAGLNGFAGKLAPDGASLVYCTYVGGAGADRVNGVAVDATGALYVAGVTDSTDLPVQSAFQGSARGQRDGFIAKLNPGGTGFLFSTYFGGQLNDEVLAIAVSATGRAVLAGSTQSRNLPVTEDAAQATLNGPSDGFLARLGPNGNALEHLTYYGGGGDDSATHLALAPARNLILVGGVTASRDFPRKSTFNQTFQGETDVWFGAWQVPAAAAFDEDPAGKPLPERESLAPGVPFGPSFVTTAGGVGRDSLISLNWNALQGRLALSVWSGSALFRFQDTAERTCTNATDTTIFLEVDGSGGVSFNGLDCGLSALSSASYFSADGVGAVAYTDRLGALTLGSWGAAPTNPVISEASELAVDDGAADAAEPVSAATGAYYAIHRDLLLRGPLPLAFTRTYSSTLDGARKIASALGPNWMHNYELRLTVAGTSATLLFHRGMVVTFRQNQGRWAPSTRAKATYQLLADGSLFRLLDPSTRLVYTFNPAENGRLEAIEDSDGRRLTLTYDGPSLRQVEDGVGRRLEFTYTGQQLTGVMDQSGRSIGFSYTGSLLTAYKDPRGFETSYTYTTSGPRAGLLVTEKRAKGNTLITNTYDGQGRVTAQVDGQGNRLTLAYDTPGAGQTTETNALNQRRVYRHDRQLPTEIIDAAGGRTQFTYDASARRISATGPGGERLTYSYHAPSGNLESVTYPDNTRYSVVYRPRVQNGFTYYDPASVTFPDGTRQEFTHDAKGHVVSRKDRAGRSWNYRWDERGLLLALELPTGGTVEWSYNSLGSIESYRRPGRAAVSYTYDELGRLVGLSRPGGRAWSRRYDAADQVISQTSEDESGAVVDYDENGQRSKSLDASGAVTYYYFDGNDRLTAYRDPLDQLFEFGYDRAARLNRVTAPDGATWQTELNGAGRPTAVVDPEGQRWTFTYDGDGRMTGVTSPNNFPVRLTRDARGRITRVNAGVSDVMEFTSDAVGRVTAVRVNGVEAGRVVYAPEGLPATVTSAGNLTANYTWGAMGVLTKATAPDGAEWRWETNGAGEIAAFLDPTGNRIGYQRDEQGRIQQIDFPEGSLALTLTPTGQVAEGLYSDGTKLNFTYDPYGYVTAGTGLTIARDARRHVVSSNGLAMSRDALGRLTSLTLAPDRVVQYSYDRAGRVTGVRDWLNGETRIARDAEGRVTQMNRPNGSVVRYGYDGNNRLRSIVDGPADGVPLMSLQFRRAADGSVAEADRTTPLDSPTDTLAAGETLVEYGAGSLATAFTYDALGRRTVDSRHTFTWNLATHLVAVSGSTSGQFSYDASGLLTSLDTGAGRLGVVWNYGTPLPSPAVFRRDDADVLYAISLPDGSLLYTVNGDGQRVFHHFDERGNIRYLSNDSGEVMAAYLWTPYGVLAGKAGAGTTPFTFLGQYGVIQIGDAGLYYNRARFYDAPTASFLSRDAQYSLDPRRWNLYQYAYGNPLLYVDYRGDDPEPAPTSAAVTGAGVVNAVGEYADKVGDSASVVATVARLAKDGTAAIEVTSTNYFGPQLGFKTAIEKVAGFGSKFNGEFGPKLGDSAERAGSLIKVAENIEAAKSTKFVKAMDALEKVGKAGDVLSVVGYGASAVVAADKLSKADAQNETDRKNTENSTSSRARAIHELYKAGKISGAERIRMLREVNANWLEEQTLADDRLFNYIALTGFQSAMDGLDTIAPPFTKDIIVGLTTWFRGKSNDIPE